MNTLQYYLLQMNYHNDSFTGIRPKGVETRPRSFFPWRLQWGYLFSSGGPTPTIPSPNFTLVPVLA